MRWYVDVAFCLLLASLIGDANCRIEELPLPTEIQTCFDEAYSKGGLSVQVGQNVVRHCIHGTLWRLANLQSQQKVPKAAMKWFADLINKSYRDAEVRHRRRKRQAMNSMNSMFGGRRQGQGQQQQPELRIRREYRMLSDRERNLFHRAILMLKADTSIPPNRFDALGRLHELLGDRSHDGPNFLGWHRFFLVVAENALREKVPSVTIPYWDSTLDGSLPDPRSSIMWTPNFMGNANGHVRTGAFAGWVTPYGPLTRNFATGGTTMNWTSIRDSFTRRHLSEIMYPHADPKYNLEDHHGEPHLWVGGHMSPVAMAGFDPVFLMHHSFIDLIWELFRRLQRRRGVDPTVDYPRNTTAAPGQAYNDQSGFGNLQNRHALSDIFTTEMYTYQLPPTCSVERPTCGSPYINCNTSGGEAPKCISASVFDIPQDQVFDLDAIVADIEAGRMKRSADNRSSNADLFIHHKENVTAYVESLESAAALKCQPENINDHYVNNYVIDGIESKSRWSYIPVSVIVRLDNRNSTDTSATYPKCHSTHAAPYRVFLEASGINYRGFYKDIVHVQKDTSVFSTVAFIGIKTPRFNASHTIIAGYDSCGRVCQPYCLDQTNGGYSACAGTIRITPDFPLQYDQSVAGASGMIWKDDVTGLPSIDETQLFFKVVCNQNVDWPWLLK